MSKILTIHQPNFFPWLGFFAKLAEADTFYVFDHVAVTTGKGWHSRVKILLNENEHWLTVPVKKKNLSGQKYFEIEINRESNFVRKHLGTIKQAYAKAPFFEEVYTFLSDIYTHDTEKLSDFNLNFIEKLSNHIGLINSILRTSSLISDFPELNHLKGNELVLRLAELSKCHIYVSGGGCQEFINPYSFEEKDIKFNFQKFNLQSYEKISSYNAIPGLSVIDNLMHLGFEGVKDLISQIND